MNVTGPIASACAFAVTDDGLYYASAPDSDHAGVVRLLSFATLQTRPIATSVRATGAGLSVSADGRLLLFTRVDQFGSDLMCIENFVPANQEPRMKNDARN